MKKLCHLFPHWHRHYCVISTRMILKQESGSKKMLRGIFPKCLVHLHLYLLRVSRVTPEFDHLVCCSKTGFSQSLVPFLNNTKNFSCQCSYLHSANTQLVKILIWHWIITIFFEDAFCVIILCMLETAFVTISKFFICAQSENKLLHIKGCFWHWSLNSFVVKLHFCVPSLKVDSQALLRLPAVQLYTASVNFMLDFRYLARRN